MQLLKKLKPDVAKVWLYAVAGLLWSGVGIFLSSLAYGWWQPLRFTAVLPLAIAGISLALTIYTFGFSKLADKNIRRIQAINQEKVCLFAFQRWHNYPLVAFMIALGVFLRHYSPIPKPILGILYLGIGGSLFLASFRYYRQIGKLETARQQSAQHSP